MNIDYPGNDLNEGGSRASGAKRKEIGKGEVKALRRKRNRGRSKKINQEGRYPVAYYPSYSVTLLLFMVFFIALKPDEAIGAIDRVFAATMSGAYPFLLSFNVFLIVVGFLDWH